LDLFGIVRVTVQVTRLPRAKPVGQHAAPVRLEEVPGTPDSAEFAVPDPPVPPPVPPEPSAPLPVPARAVAPAADQESVARSLISLADDLAGLADRASGEGAGGRTLRLAQWRVDQVLAECGVEAVNDEGPVDPSRHEVVGSRSPAGEGTAGWIAATVRRGYLMDGQLMRPQQVVAYTANTRGTAEGSEDAGRG